jgi:hypothetical protein
MRKYGPIGDMDERKHPAALREGQRDEETVIREIIEY